jgi:hypothetical protein
MAKNECLAGYFETMRFAVLTFGAPQSVYSDRHTIFRSPNTTVLEDSGEDAPLTEFGRSLRELGANIIHARTPQAKGRVERLWGTLQSRLPIELRKRGIETVDAANEFLQSEYIGLFNERFSVAAEGSSVLVPYSHPYPIDFILSVKSSRLTDSVGGFSYKGQYFSILDEGYPLIPARRKITVMVGARVGVKIEYNDRYYARSPTSSKKPQTKTTPTLSCPTSGMAALNGNMFGIGRTTTSHWKCSTAYFLKTSASAFHKAYALCPLHDVSLVYSRGPGAYYKPLNYLISESFVFGEIYFK